MNYAIISTNTKAFWSNLYGWVSFDNADIFDASEATALDLPCDGEWVPASEFEVKTVSELAEVLARYPSTMRFRFDCRADPLATKGRVRIAAADEAGVLCDTEDEFAHTHVVLLSPL